jgi:protein SCO1
MKKTATIWFFVIVLVIPMMAFAIFNWYEKKIGSLPFLTEKNSIAASILFDQENNRVSIPAIKNKTIVADFFFTHCPTICPKMTRQMQRVADYFNDNTELMFLSITVDPERDSAARLKQYVYERKITNKNWLFLTGSKQDIYKLARNSFKIVASDGDGGPADFIHSDKLVLLDKQKRIRGYYNGTGQKEVDQLITDIKKLNHED